MAGLYGNNYRKVKVDYVATLRGRLRLSRRLAANVTEPQFSPPQER